ncbi:hypothetical protein [Sorangium sp. So ce131]|uniref:hypothetical protein n=1 Tax=Sorangium sp. So ce131 TaxID=3133282 RepID=UPI003F630B55
MSRFFNTAGPNEPERHYTVPVLSRLPRDRARADGPLRAVPGETLAIEIKVWRPREADPLDEGLRQIDGYLAGLGLSTGWLVLFDRRPDAPPLPERLGAAPATTPGGRQVTVIRA